MRSRRTVSLASATGINDAGQIVEHGSLNGKATGFLLTPTAAPEPSSLATFGITGLCLSVLVLTACRRSAQSAG